MGLRFNLTIMEDPLPELPTLDALGSQGPTEPLAPAAPPAPIFSAAVTIPSLISPPSAVGPTVSVTPLAPPPPTPQPVVAEEAPPPAFDKPLAPNVEPIQQALAREIVVRKPPMVAKPITSRLPSPMVFDATSLPAVKEEPRSIPVAPRRLLALDAFRGFIMLLLASSGFGIAGMAKKDGTDLWDQLKIYVEHVQWSGCVPWDLIQPAFMFMVGVAMPFSYSKRLERGDSMWRLFDHAVFRSVILVLLGVFLSSPPDLKATNWIFTNVLAQIGLGYLVLFALWRMGTGAQVLGFLAILVGYGLWFGYSPLNPGYVYEFNPTGLQPTDLFDGFFAHWNIHTNPAATFDRWFLNLFPRAGGVAYTVTEGGYQTLNFVPAIGTMILGLWAGRFLRTDRSDTTKTITLLLAGAVLAGLGFVIGEQFCPVVKRIWTPSWVLLSGGFVVLMLGAFYAVIEWFDMPWLGKPLSILGMNSIFVYLAIQLSKGFFRERLNLHVFSRLPKEWMTAYGPMIEACSILAVIWLLCWWLYRQRAFLRI